MTVLYAGVPTITCIGSTFERIVPSLTWGADGEGVSGKPRRRDGKR